jgi:hypothetical protein
MADDNANEIWVNVTEAAEITGYSRQHMKMVISGLWQIEESQRGVRMRKRSSGFDVWLPDLLVYLAGQGRRGPYTKADKSDA